MEAIPRDYGEQCRFDAFCKTVLRNEARNYHRDMKRQRDRETSFGVLPQAELDKLYTVDHYPSDDFVFSSHGYDLHIDNELVAAAFAELPQQAQSIFDFALCSGTGRRRDRRTHGNVQKCRPAAQDKNAERAANKIDGVDAGGRLDADEKSQLQRH